MPSKIKLKLPKISKISVKVARKAWKEKFGKVETIDTRSLPFIKPVFSAVFLNLLVIVSILGLLNRLPPEVPLYYGLAETADRLAPNWFLILPCLAAIGFTAVNILISALTEDIYLRKTLMLTCLVITFFSVVTTFKIARLVGSF